MLLFHILSSIAIAVVAVAILIRIFLLKLPSFDNVIPKYFEAIHFLQWFAVQSDAENSVASFIHNYFGVLCVEFHSLCAGSFSEFVVQVLQLTDIARHLANIICETQITNISTTGKDRRGVAVESFLQNSLQNQVEGC